MDYSLERRMEMCKEINQMGYLKGICRPADTGGAAYETSVHSKATYISNGALADLHRTALAKFRAEVDFFEVVHRVLDEGFLRNVKANDDIDI